MESNAINWSKIVIYSSVLFFAQSAIGFLEGFLSPGANDTTHEEIGLWFALSNLITIIVAASLYAHLAIYQASRPLVHASLSLALYGAASLGLFLVLKPLLGLAPTVLILLNFLVLIPGVLAGLFIGIAIRRMKTYNQKMSRNI